MSSIIFLNGPGSAGKTSIAKAIQHISQQCWLRLGVDTIIDMMPAQYLPSGRKANEGLDFVPETNARGPVMRCECGPIGHQVFFCLPTLAKEILSKGNNLILDEVLLSDKMLKEYVATLKENTVYFVGIACDLEVMQERELLRGNRAIGLSNDQVDRAHSGIREYDIKLDTTHRSPFSLAEEILSFVNQNPVPSGFKKMATIFGV